MANALVKRSRKEALTRLHPHGALAIAASNRTECPIPMFENVSMVFDGLLFRRSELLEKLSDSPHSSLTNSDAELALRAYLKWGLDFLSQIDGHFSMAVYNHVSNDLLLARDPFGARPLLWAETNAGFVFSTDATAILASGLVHAAPCWQGLSLGVKFFAVPPPFTAFEGIKSLQSGYLLTVKAGVVTENRRFWDMQTDEIKEIDPANAIDQLEALLKRSIQNVAKSEHGQVGLLMSGGIDSTTLGAIARNSSPNIHSFTFAMKGDDEHIDETSYARSIAEKIGIKHSSLIFDIDCFEDFLRDYVDILEAPNTRFDWCLPIAERLSASGIHSVMLGSGADAALHGLQQDVWMCEAWPLRRKFRLLGHFLSNPTLRKLHLCRNALEYSCSFNGSLQEIGNTRIFARSIHKESESMTEFASRRFDLSRKKFAAPQLLMSYLTLHSTIDRTVFSNSRTLGAFGIAAHCPFLEKDFVTFCLSLPKHLKIVDGQGKVVMRQLAKRYFDWNTLGTPRKTGFGVTMRMVFKTPKMKQLYMDCLESLKRRGCFERDYLQIVTDRMHHQEFYSSQALFLVSFELWFQRFID
jgi:asparagine synthase (glutamine-hydrolysing)